MSDEREPTDARRLELDMIEAVQKVIGGTDWSPPDGGIVTECVVVIGWIDTDGDHGSNFLRCGSPWGTEGLLIEAVRRIQEPDITITMADPDDE